MKRNPFRSDSPREPDPSASAVSRRAFLKGLSTSAVAAAALGSVNVARGFGESDTETDQGPGAVPITLTINGESRPFRVEPRTTLLEVLREQAGLTGAKEACDRATCGSCTVLRDDVPVYACSVLAIEAQGAKITTIEGLSRDERLTVLQQAFIDHDGVQCGFCTSGMILVITALLRRNPHPTEAEVREACAGNLCRCGSYPRIFAAGVAAGGGTPAPKLTVLQPHDHGLA